MLVHESHLVLFCCDIRQNNTLFQAAGLLTNLTYYYFRASFFVTYYLTRPIVHVVCI